MAFKVTKLQKKSNDWLVVSLLDAAGDITEEVSVNRISKKGDLFPGFDEITEGEKVEGRLWKSDSHKMYLFAPKGSAKAPVKEPVKSTDDEYPVSAKLETILNKMTAIQIDIQIIKEVITPKTKAKAQVEEYPPNDFEDVPFDLI